MRILFVSPRQCWPATGGAKLREFHLAKALGTRASLHYIFFAAPQGEPPSRSDLPFCESIAAAPPLRPYSAGKLLRGLLGRVPLSVLNYSSPEMTSLLSRAAAGASFDLIHLDSIHLAAYQPLLQRLQPQARIVYDWHNIESGILRQYAANAPSAARRIYSTLTIRKLAAVEDDALRTSFGHLVCSARERDELLRRAPSARIEVIENGAVFSPSPASAPVRNRIVFVGLMNYHANVEAAQWFARSIWPAIRARFPHLRLTLVGADPAPQVRAFAALEGVEVTGTVPAIAPYYEDALAAVVPLLTGGGTRLKILEAMAAGVPVISTALGAEGLDVSPGENILIAPGTAAHAQASPAQVWSEALASIVPQNELWTRLAAAGKALVASRYDWDALGRKLFELYSAWIAPPR
jgi:glycosyltransferase involved in cell wall biosynthesis